MGRALSFLKSVCIAPIVWVSACAPNVSVTTVVPSVAARITTLTGASTTLEEVRGGRPALVVMWATWCEACRDEFQSVAKLAPKVSPDAALVLLSVGEDADTVHAFLNDHPLPGVVLLDPAFAYADSKSERRVPTTLVIDRRGTIVHRGGALDADALAALRKVIGAD